MDTASALITIAGILGTLGGVIIGTWFTGRNERFLLRETHRREDRQARIDACVEFLATYRLFRSYVVTHDVAVVVSSTDEGRDLAYIKDAPEHIDAVQQVLGRLLLLEGGQGPLVEAAREVQQVHRDLVLARAREPSSSVPPKAIEAALRAEQDFILIAHRELSLDLPQRRG